MSDESSVYPSTYRFVSGKSSDLSLRLVLTNMIAQRAKSGTGYPLSYYLSAPQLRCVDSAAEQ